MHTEDIIYFDGQQKLIGKLVYQEKSTKKRPAIMIFHALEGRAEFVLKLAEKYAKQGYIAFAVDIYGDARTANSLPSGFELIGPLIKDREAVRRRSILSYETVKNNPMVDASKIGAIGFCFGGMCILELARAGEPLTAGVCCHAALAKSDLPTRAVVSKLLLLQGYKDPQVPANESLKAFAEEMQSAGNTDWTFTFFGNAKHSFTDPATGSFDPIKEAEMGREYNAEAAALAFEFGEIFLKKWLH